MASDRVREFRHVVSVEREHKAWCPEGGAVGPARNAELSSQRHCSLRGSAPRPGPEFRGLGTNVSSQLTILKGYGPLDGEG